MFSNDHHVLNSRAVRLSGALMLGTTILLASACGDKAAKERAAADSALARDLALANSPTSQQPTFQDTTVAPAPTPTPTKKDESNNRPAPVRTRTERKPERQQPQPVAQTPPPQPQPAPVAVAQAPATAPAATPAPARGEIGTGTGFGMTTGSKVCTSNLPGDKLVATLNSAVTGSNGASIPAGSTVVLEIASVNPGENGANPQINFRVRSIVVNDKTYSVTGDVATETPLEKTKVAGTDPNAEKKKVIGGAIAGAIIGQMIGHNTKGTVIGAAAGAATGAAISKGGQKYEGCLPAGASLHMTLSQSIVM